MIRNEKQYRITKNQAEKFRASLETLSAADADVNDTFHDVKVAAIESQLDDLLGEIAEYEELQSGKISEIQLDDFEALPIGLIKARIVLGLNQKELAERLGLKEQQIQRYEADNYRTASFGRLVEIADALGIKIKETIEIDREGMSLDGLLERVDSVGLERDLLIDRILSPRVAAQISGGQYEDEQSRLVANAASDIGKVFGWNAAEIYGSEPLEVSGVGGATARFKMPATRDQGRVSAYVGYAKYLAGIVLDSMSDAPLGRFPDDAQELREAIHSNFGALNLETVAQFCWDQGTPVLALRDPGAFHGACWRVGGRNIIVLKQTSDFASRWLFDLLHEMKHASENPDDKEFEVLEEEETSASRRESENEIAASQFAGDVLLAGRAEQLAQLCVQNANGNLKFLKNAVIRVAAQEDVNLGALAYYLAYRLTLQGENWWGAATNLQEVGDHPWTLIRDVFFERFNFEHVSTEDSELLQRALS